jgi:hypothetical protein
LLTSNKCTPWKKLPRNHFVMWLAVTEQHSKTSMILDPERIKSRESRGR